MKELDYELKYTHVQQVSYGLVYHTLAAVCFDFVGLEGRELSTFLGLFLWTSMRMRGAYEGSKSYSIR